MSNLLLEGSGKLLREAGGNLLLEAPELGTEIQPGSSPTNQYQQTLRVSPIDANVMTIVMKTGTSEHVATAFNTQDGASSWSNSSVSGTSGRSDPALAFDLDGDAYWSTIDFANKGIAVKKATDGGGSWGSDVEAVTTTASYIDHPVIAVDKTSTSPYAGRVYVSGAPRGTPTGYHYTAYSDNGTSWTDVPVDVSSYADLLGGSPFPSIASQIEPAICSDGTVLIPVQGADTEYALIYGSSKNLYFFKSTDGGDSYSIIGPVATKVYPNSSPSWKNGGYYFFSNPIVGPKPGGGERIYVVFSQVSATDPASHSLITSDDKGDTWSIPATINAPTGHSAGPMSLAVNANGIVGVQYIGINQLSTAFDVYFYYLKGGTGSPPIKISGGTSTLLDVPSPEPRSPGADQVSMGAGPDWKFWAIWPDNRANTADTYATYIRSITVPL